MRLPRVVAAVALAAATALSTPVAVTAHAAPAGNVVTFGDSYTANPDEIRNTLRGINIPAVQEWVWNYPHNDGCLQGPNNWPRQLGLKVGAPVNDWSCTAETSQSVLGKIDSAITAGDIHPGTRSVIIAVGMNDYGPFGIRQGFNPLDPRAMEAKFVENMGIAADKIRAVAPGAKIIISGSVAVSEPTAPHMFCPFIPAPNVPIGFPLPPLNAVEVDNEAHQKAAAAAHGLEFVEMRAGSAGHTMCAPDAQRYVAGGIDVVTPGKTMGMHPNELGSDYISTQLANAL